MDLVLISHTVKRRLGNIQVTFLDQFRHGTEEKGEEQGADVAAVHVGIGHDDSPIAQAFEVEIIAHAGAEGRDERLDFITRKDFVQPGALGVHDFSPQRQNRLEVLVATLFGRSTS